MSIAKRTPLKSSRKPLARRYLNRKTPLRPASPKKIAEKRAKLGLADPEYLRAFQYLRLHKLKGKMQSQYSMSFSKRGRIIFQFDESQGDAYDVFISPDHYGD